MKPSMSTTELVSSLADGHLDENEFVTALRAIEQDGSALQCWGTYHLIGDVLRSPAHMPVMVAIDADLAFVERLIFLEGHDRLIPRLC